MTARSRLLFVHAHPDDETLTTGLTMARYAREGHDVHVLTCTLGEEGEVIPRDLRHLAADREDQLGPYRREELRRAMAALGVDHQVLGEDPGAGVLSRYRDSGMAGMPSAAREGAFVRADLDEAAALVAAHMQRLEPDVVVTYDDHGGYGHPDHIQTHRVTMAALVLLAQTGCAPAAYGVFTPRGWVEEDRRWLAQHVDLVAHPDLVVPDLDHGYALSVVADATVTHEVQAADLIGAQAAALAEHATQVTVFEGGYYALSNDIAARLSGREGFARLDPSTGLPVPGAADGGARHTGLLRGRSPGLFSGRSPGEGGP